MVDRRPTTRRNRNTSDRTEIDDGIDWYMWLPCTGVNGLLPPLAKWSDLNDGTYSLGDVERMNQVINQSVEKYNIAKANAAMGM